MDQLINVYSQDDRIYIHSTGATASEDGTLEIYNLQGQRLYMQKIAAVSLVSVPLNVSSGYLIVRVRKQSGTIVQKKCSQSKKKQVFLSGFQKRQGYDFD